VHGAAAPVPPPPGHLLRPGGGTLPPDAAAEPADILATDAALLLTGDPRAAGFERWHAEAFVAQVAAIRRHLAPIRVAGLLRSSFAREAFLGTGLGPVPAVAASPVRVAYAIRWIELEAGLDLPAWPAWLEWTAPR
jgi:hypothetical protein